MLTQERKTSLKNRKANIQNFYFGFEMKKSSFPVIFKKIMVVTRDGKNSCNSVWIMKRDGFYKQAYFYITFIRTHKYKYQTILYFAVNL